MIFETVDLVISLAAAGMGGYAIFRKPRIVESQSVVERVITVIPPTSSGHAECANCHNVVARYKGRADGTVICANCEGLA